MRILLSVYEPSPATLAAFAPQAKPSKRSTEAAVAVPGAAAAAAQTVPVIAVEAEPQIEASRLHRAAAAGDADKVR